MNEYTIIAFTETHSGMLQRVASVFTRRHIDIQSINSSKSSLEGIYRYTIVVISDPDEIIKLVKSLEKQVEVLKAFYYEADQIVYQEIALYKIPTKGLTEFKQVESLIRSHNARILSIENEYIVVEKTGHASETEALLDAFRDIGVYEFVRSGRVAIVKPMERLKQYLSTVEKIYK